MNLKINNKWIKKFKTPFFICGPCSIDNKYFFFKTIKKLYNYGFRIFRAGIWKPRTNPNSFEGIGITGLKWINLLKKKYINIFFATEIANKKHILLCIKYNIDILWIGARTTSNPFLIKKISHNLKYTKKIILIKNPIHNEIELLFGTIKRLNQNKIFNIGIIHRGCFNENFKLYYRNYPEWNIILNIKKKNNNIPIIFDPSHIAGNNIYIYNLLKKSKIFNYNGYIIESHIKPKKALSDNLQQLKPKIIKKYINKIFYNNNNNNNNNNKLKIKRLEIDEIDKKIIFNIYNRCLIINKIKKIKKIHNINIIQKKRYKKIFKIYKKYSYLLKIPYILKIFKIIYKLSIFLQKGIIKL